MQSEGAGKARRSGRGQKPMLTLTEGGARVIIVGGCLRTSEVRAALTYPDS